MCNNRPYTATGTLIPTCNSQRIKVGILYSASCNSIICMLAIAIERWRALSSTVYHRGSAARAKCIVVVGWIISLGYGMTLAGIQETQEYRMEFEGRANVNQTWCPNFSYCYYTG